MGKKELKKRIRLHERQIDALLTEKEEREKAAKLGPQLKIKKDPTPAQKKVQDTFSHRARVASQLYHQDGSQLTWGEAMIAAGAFIQNAMNEEPKPSVGEIEDLKKLILPEVEESEKKE